MKWGRRPHSGSSSASKSSQQVRRIISWWLGYCLQHRLKARHTTRLACSGRHWRGRCRRAARHRRLAAQQRSHALGNGIHRGRGLWRGGGSRGSRSARFSGAAQGARLVQGVLAARATAVSTIAQHARRPALTWPPGMRGKTDASTTRSPSTPCTRSWSSTAEEPSAAPICGRRQGGGVRAIDVCLLPGPASSCSCHQRRLPTTPHHSTHAALRCAAWASPGRCPQWRLRSAPSRAHTPPLGRPW